MSGYEVIGEVPLMQRPVSPKIPFLRYNHLVIGFLVVLVTGVSVGLVAWKDLEGKYSGDITKSNIF